VNTPIPIRNGPPVRFNGVLNALIVLPTTHETSIGEPVVNQVDAWRQKNIREKWPRRGAEARSVNGLTVADHERGYTVSPVNVLRSVMPDDVRLHSEAAIQLRATPGEYVPITFAITPLQALGKTTVELKALHGLIGTTEALIPAEGDLVSGVVRYVASAVGKQGREW
jgi:hypothetical protein